MIYLGLYNKTTQGFLWRFTGRFSLRSKMLKLLDGKRANVKRKTRQLLKDPFFKTGILKEKDAHRLKIFEMTKELAKQGYGSLAYPEVYGGANDIASYMAIFETLAYHDLSLTVKFSVQFGLLAG